MKRASFFWAACCAVLLCGSLQGLAAAELDSITVFAAASTTNAVTEIGRLFAAERPLRFIPSFASSSTLAKQIENGAPADIFLSANKKWMDYLEWKKLIDSATRFDLLSNRIVLIAPIDSEITQIHVHPSFELAKRLQDGWLAMGDPDHVPGGMYARQALAKLGAWQAIEARVARAKDVRAALVLVERGEASLGIVYATDAAITGKVKVVGLLPEHSHPPIVYPVATVAGRQTPVVEGFMDFLQTREAKAVFEKCGFKVRR
jgi:molybdate transport system substrate-binding protein